MYTPEQIAEFRNSQIKAIFERFEPVETEVVSNDLTKSEDIVEFEKETSTPTKFWTKESLEQFKSDLFKGVDNGTVTEDDLIKAQDELLDLVKSTTIIDGEEKEIFMKSEDLEKGSPGSRGGKIIGTTKSGKPIYSSASHESHANFTKQDHLDAAGVHSELEKKWDSKMPKDNRRARASVANEKAEYHFDQGNIHSGLAK